MPHDRARCGRAPQAPHSRRRPRDNIELARRFRIAGSLPVVERAIAAVQRARGVGRAAVCWNCDPHLRSADIAHACSGQCNYAGNARPATISISHSRRFARSGKPRNQCTDRCGLGARHPLSGPSVKRCAGRRADARFPHGNGHHRPVVGSTDGRRNDLRSPGQSRAPPHRRTPRSDDR